MTTATKTPMAGAGSASGPGAVTSAVEQALRALGGVRPTVVIAFPTPAEHLAVGVAHGCQPRSAPSIVTKAEGRTVLQLDGRRAEDVYLEKLGLADRVLQDFEFDAVSVVHPLAQPELSGDVRLRHVLGRSPEGA